MSNYINGKKMRNTVTHAKNVAEYVVNRLVDLGINDVFALPGDFAFAIDEALINNKQLRYIGSTNELNASYAADGYARVKGAAMLSTTYAVGELSAINGVMGAKAENNVIFHLVGLPPQKMIQAKQQIHHTLGDNDFTIFSELSAKSACVSAIITPDNVIGEMNRVIQEAFLQRKPAYIAVGVDIGRMPILDTSEETEFNFVSNELNLASAVEIATSAISAAKSIVVIPSIKLDRFGITQSAIDLIRHLGLNYVIMPHDKSVLNEIDDNYLGLFMGALSDAGIQDKINSADLILDLGGLLWSDLSTGMFTAQLDMNKVLSIKPHELSYKNQQVIDISFSDVVNKLINILPKQEHHGQATKAVAPINGEPQAKITLDSLYTHIANSLRANDNVIVETGSSSVNFIKLTLPKNVKYHNQTLWGSIGWATPAALGCVLAQETGRTFLITGEGSHLLTLNELATMGHYNAAPIIFCINNNGYLVERALEVDPDHIYNDLPKVQYHLLPQALGCINWKTFVVTTNQELADAIGQALRANVGVYIEVIAARYDYGNVLDIISKNIKQQ